MAEMMGQAAPAAEAGGEGGGGTAQIINDVGNGLAVVADAVLQSQAPDEIKQRIGMLVQEYGQIMQELMGGGATAGGGAVPVEQGGAPMSPAGV